MTQTFTYDFTNGDGNTSDIVVTAASASTNDSGNGLGYDIQSISGTFDGKVISGIEGASGENQDDDNIGPWDNVIFTDSSQGAVRSTDGIDANGIAFTTTDGQAYSVYSLNGQFEYQTVTLAGNPLSLVSYDPASSGSPPCYTCGTRILTCRGEVPVENLEVFDQVITASGEMKPIVWIGRRRIDITRHPRPQLVRPVRIAAGALGNHMPVRDLLVSPEHALWLENSLVPARELINGATIRQEDHKSVQYYHVELEDHDILLAEGVPAESYLDCDNRGSFDNAANGVVALPPDWRALATARPFASAAAVARLRRDFVGRARDLGRGAEVRAFEAEQRIRASVTRTNFVRNPRAEGSVRGLMGAGGQAPVHWLVSAPDGIAILVMGHGSERDLSFVDLRFIGFARASGSCCIYPEPGSPASARANQDWTFSCHLRRIEGSAAGVDAINLYIDECDATGGYLTGQGYPRGLPTADDLMHQRISATRRMTRPDVAVMRGYVQIEVAADTLVDLTLRIGGMQIEEGDYASDLILPPPGAHQTSTRMSPSETRKADTKRRVA